MTRSPAPTARPGALALSRKSTKRRYLWWLLAPGLFSVSAGVIASLAIDTQTQTQAEPEVKPAPKQFAVTINRPDGPPVIQTGQLDERGQPIVVNCSTCHATKTPNARLSDGAKLEDFHNGLKTNHGDRTCLSCHDPSDYNQLRLADGQPVSFQDVITLCAQCHGPQYKDYQNGAHGGMTGFWDLNRGPRVRNNCIDCHDPHAPQFPKLMPVLRPNDRFLRSESSENAHE
jgi:formate-dependent nitrite reductase cytochrome c552 subunit